ncbi:probable WRKY transcription factor 4 [Sorghum bicolor]|nr:probable WRKY transcription factor 4 [Sorghum bicolor]|eukprot:XP_002467677.2 probable WRKY transcription factor 4 [Sorghum bicolor]
MSHQQALAQVTAQAVHSQYNMINHADYAIPFSSTTTPALITAQHANSSANVTSAQEKPALPSHTGNSKIESNEVSQGLKPSAPTFDKPADDGYNWRKYGQKAVKGGEYPRSYYKCTHASCPVKKKVERSAEGYITQIIYRGQHNHQRPPKRRSKDGGGLLNEADDFHENEDTSTRSEPGSQDHSGKHEGSNDGIAGPSVSRRGEGHEQLSGSSDSDEERDDEQRAGNGDPGYANANRRHVPTPAQRIIVQTNSEVDLLDDGYRWRKYGQKVVKGNPHPRSYYKCTYQGCDVKKHIERSSQDPKAVITTYEGKHSHDVPAARNSSHAAANANCSSSTSVPHRVQSSASSSRRVADLQSTSSASSMLLKEENEIT